MASTAERTLTYDEVRVEIAQQRVRNRVGTENHRQLQKWGVQDHEPSFWFLILMEEMGELAAAILTEDTAGTIPPEHRGILLSASNLGAGAQMVLEGKLPDRVNVGMGTVAEGHNSGEETLHVAAVAVAMEESRVRRLMADSQDAAGVAW